jgi:hypothetical protein
VNTSTTASATPGSTAQAISAARRAAVVGVSALEARAGEMMTERTIAYWAIEQHATAIQKIASPKRNDMSGKDL